MGFLRPKSRGKGDDAEQKRRNRLSKPLTNKSQTNLRAAAKQDMVNEEAIKSKSQLDLDEVIHSPTKEDSRAKARSHLFQLDTNTEPASKQPQQVKSGVAQLVAQYENGRPSPSSSQLSLNSKANKRPMSAMVVSPYSPTVQNSRPGYAGMSTKPEYRFSPQSPPAGVDDQMWSHVPDQHPIPTRRRSNFVPGEATRKTSAEARMDYPRSQPKQANVADDASVSSRNDEYVDANDSWTISPQFAYSRSETPRNIECTALGSLTLGSLRITNGRASPDLSVVTLQTKQRQVSSKLRDVSSEYGDSEAWEDEAVPDDQSDAASTGRKTPTNGLQRNFSFIEGAETQLTAESVFETFSQDNASPPRTPTQKSPAPTSALAEEYMAELPPSPFVENKSPPIEQSVNESRFADSPTGSTGSVIHHDLEDEQDDFISCIGNSAANSPIPRGRKVSDESHQSADSKPSFVESKVSSTDSRFAQDDGFRSALEFQQYLPPPSPERPRAPFMTSELTKSDSGYSSNASVRSMHAVVEKQANVQQERLPEASEVLEKIPSKPSTPKKLGGFLPIRPMMRSRNTAPAAPVLVDSRPQTSQSLQSAPPLTQTEDATVSPLTPTKQRKKLQKFKVAPKIAPKITPKIASPKPGRLAEVIVQRNHSVESYNIPAVPAQAIANLRLRSEQLPELERTVRNHTKQSSGSSSNLAVHNDIRFPTPNPEPEEDERESRKSKTRSKSRPRSKSRRRSMLEFFTGSKDDKRKSVSNQDHVEMTIDDLGDVVAALGSNPYDIAVPVSRSHSRSNERSGSYDMRQRPQSMDLSTPRHLPPYRISHQTNPQKFMMDDQTASQYARSRSRSIHERDRWNDRPSSPHPPSRPSSSRRSSFNDRGGIPGKNLRSLSTNEDTPPLPPMPSPAEIRRMSGRYDGWYTTQQTKKYERPHWSSELSQEPEEAAPLPPPHSPRPSFVEEREYPFEEPEDLSLAPPPPCHSPLPMDLPPEPMTMPENGWATQAREWRARRQSAGETLRAQWGHTHDEHFGNSNGNMHSYGNTYDQANNPYPDIPPKRHTEYYDGSENWPPQTVNERRWDTNHEYHHRYPQDDYGWDSQDHQYGGYGQQPDLHNSQSNRYYEDTGYTSPPGRRPQLQQNHSYNSQNSHHSRNSYRDQTLRNGHSRSRDPSPTPSSRPLPSRPTSRISYRSNNSAVSLAEELHPEHLERNSRAPDFGRYSGGLQYSYEGRGKGFGGSAGTRSVSGKADGQWKGMELKQNYGVDLGDVPIMGVVRPLR